MVPLITKGKNCEQFCVVEPQARTWALESSANSNGPITPWPLYYKARSGDPKSIYLKQPWFELRNCTILDVKFASLNGASIQKSSRSKFHRQFHKMDFMWCRKQRWWRLEAAVRKLYFWHSKHVASHYRIFDSAKISFTNLTPKMLIHCKKIRISE